MTAKKQIKETETPGLLEIMAKRFNLGNATFLTTLKGTIMKADKSGKGPSDSEIITFLLVAKKYNLNPFTKEIYAFPDKRAGIVPVVGVDGFTTIANRHKDYNGYDIEWAEDMVDLEGAKSCPEWCEIKVYRKDREHAIVVREYLDEVYIAARGGYSGPWQTHTKRMLRHKTLIQGFRVAFGITGVYDEDEATRIVDAKIVEDEGVGKPDVELPGSIEDKGETEMKVISETPGPTIEEEFFVPGDEQ